MINDKSIQQLTEQFRQMNVNHNVNIVYAQTNNRVLQELCNELNIFIVQQQEGLIQYENMKKSYQRMLSNASHDLKTPLTIILGLLELVLNDDNLDIKNKNALRKTYEKANELSDMIINFFNLYKLESGDIEIELSRIDITSICRETILSFYDLIQEHGLSVEADIPEKPIYILGNKPSLIRILNNLIQNAISYGSDGGKIGICVEVDEQETMITIWDCGKGIEEKFMHEVFERLYTLEDSRNKNYQGSGLGLTISKRLTEQMNGSIKLTSKPYQKTSFTVIFPLLKY